MPQPHKLGAAKLSHSSPQIERRFLGHSPASDSFRRRSRLRSAHSPQMEGLALSHVGAPSFAVSAKGGNALPLPESNVRLKLLEKFLTRLKSVTSLFLIDNFCRHLRSRSSHCLEMESLALSHAGAPSPVFGVRWTPPDFRDRTFAVSAKGGNGLPLAQSTIRVKLLEILLTRVKSVTSLFLIDKFLPHLELVSPLTLILMPLAKERSAHD